MFAFHKSAHLTPASITSAVVRFKNAFPRWHGPRRLEDEYAAWMRPREDHAVPIDPALACNQVITKQSHDAAALRALLFAELRQWGPGGEFGARRAGAARRGGGGVDYCTTPPRPAPPASAPATPETGPAPAALPCTV